MKKILIVLSLLSGAVLFMSFGKREVRSETIFDFEVTRYQVVVENGEEIMDGYYLEYADEGVLDLRGSYKMGKKEGKWEEFYEDGELYKEYSYVDGKLHGKYSVYDTDGEVLRSGNFIKGKRDGIWEYALVNNTIRKCVYKNGIRAELIGEWEFAENSFRVKKILFNSNGRCVVTKESGIVVEGEVSFLDEDSNDVDDKIKLPIGTFNIDTINEEYLVVISKDHKKSVFPIVLRAKKIK